MESAKVPFDWKHLGSVAKDLIQHAASKTGQEQEAFYRASVSRSYYRAFKCAYDFLIDHEGDRWLRFDYAVTCNNQKAKERIAEELSIDVATCTERYRNAMKSCHTYVIFQLSKINKDVADALRDLKAERQDADYNAELRVTDATAKQALYDSGQIVKKIQLL